MMRTIRLGVILGMGLVATPSTTLAQVPGAPALPGGPVPAVPGGAGAAAGAGATGGATGATGPTNIWSFFMKTPDQKAQLKACFCNSRIGQFMNNMMLPMGTMTGGILGPICPGPNVPNPADLAKPATSAQGAAAKIKAEEAQAKAKIAALEYLATVDCRYYPEAEAAMITGLRAEKNECVRLAAAKALASGCCCSAKVVKALTICVNCSTRDGFPAEASELVRTYAYVALERCLQKCVEAEPELPPEPPPAAKKAMYETLAPIGTIPDYTAAILLASYYSLESTETHASLIAAARVAVGRGLQISPQTIARLHGPRNVRDSLFPGEITRTAPARSPQITLSRSAPGPFAPGDPRQPALAGATIESTEQMPLSTPERKPGRGNLLNVLQDSFKRQ